MKRNFLFLLIVILSLTLGAHAGKKYKASGTVSGTILWEEEQELPDGNTLRLNRVSQMVTVTEADPGYPFSEANCMCSSSSINSDTTRNHLTSCICFDSDGDCYWNIGEGDQTGGTFTFIKGTGKFKGVKGNGSWSYLSIFARLTENQFISLSHFFWFPARCFFRQLLLSRFSKGFPGLICNPI